MNQSYSSAAHSPNLSSPSHQPRPIPSDKQTKALQLYKQYKLEKTLSQQPRTHHGYNLTIPGPAAPRSTTSIGSSRRQRALSISTSAYEVATELSSVVSFDGNEDRRGELISFDGKKVKQRTRRRLDPTKRAKAALVRWLGACPSCRSRRVPCALEHHDIEKLEELYEASKGHRPALKQKTNSSSSSASHQTSKMSAVTEENTSEVSQTFALAGIGGNEELHEHYDTSLDIQSPDGAGEDQIQLPVPATLNLTAPNLPVLVHNPHSNCQDGDMFAIGVLRHDGYQCRHLDGLCQQLFDDAEMLQNHFEFFHFGFTRLNPADRYLCSSKNCRYLNDSIDGPCHNCGSYNQFEQWICGSFKPIPSLQRQRSTSQLSHGYNDSQGLYSSYSLSSQTSPWKSDNHHPQFTNFNVSVDLGSQNGDGYSSLYDYAPSQDSEYGGDSHNLYRVSDFGNAPPFRGRHRGSDGWLP